MTTRARRLVAIGFLLLGLSGCGTGERPLALATNVDLQRYAGHWFVIANIPYFAEKGNVGTSFDISFKPDGTLTDLYTGHAHDFDAPAKTYTMNGYVVPDTGNARWRESPFWPLYLSYLILYVDADYRTALVGYPGREYGWILSRDPVMDDATYQSLLQRFNDQGYDITLFRKVPQEPGQIGKPGLRADGTGRRLRRGVVPYGQNHQGRRQYD
jgi:apolipoprotein D and lipocalin family protein